MDKSKQKRFEQIMNILLKEYPSTKTTLNNMRHERKRDPFKILISCLLSLRTQDKNTEKASSQLFAVASTPQEIVQMPLPKLEKLIYSSGHYKKKSRVLKHVSSEIINRFKGQVPDTEEELLSIKGIGRKTANIVLGFAFDKLVLPIDTHCHRIPNRLGLIKTKNPEQTELEVAKILAKKYWAEFNSLFVQFGQTICVPISPKCSECPVSKLCKRVGVVKSR